MAMLDHRGFDLSDLSLSRPEAIDAWFPALGLPDTVQHAPGQWSALATWPGDRMIFSDETEGELVMWPDHRPHRVQVEFSGDVLCEGMERLIWAPAEFVALAMAMRDDDDYLDEDRARAWVANLRGTPEPVAPSPWRSAADLAGVPVPDRRWLIEGLVPDRNVTLLTGDGGTGKSLLALQMAVAVATGAEWLGQPVRAGRAVVVSAEDDADEVHRRLHGIALGLGMGLGDMPRLVFRSLVGEGALLAEKGRTGFKPTALLAEIEAAAEGARLVVLDTLANFYPGDENDRAQTTHFVDLIKGVALRARCAVLLLAHPSKSAMDNGAGYSGNTAWNNAVRSRLYLKRITRQDGAEVIEPDPDARVLRTMKANYGRAAGEMSLSWCGGLFVPSAPETSLDRAAANAKADRVFLALLDAREASGRHVSHNPGPTYAPAVFARDDEAEGLTKRALAAAMERLFAAGRIVIKTHGSGAKARSHIGRGGENE